VVSRSDEQEVGGVPDCLQEKESQIVGQPRLKQLPRGGMLKGSQGGTGKKRITQRRRVNRVGAEKRKKSRFLATLGMTCFLGVLAGADS
jgi:hypothetical protein